MIRTCVLLLLSVAATAAEPVRVLFPEQAPFTYTDAGGRPAGERIERVRAWFRRAGFEPQFESVPSGRIIAALRQNQEAFCSLSWYYTAERAAYARYTPPYQYDRLVLIARRKRAEEFRRYARFEDLVREETYRIGETGYLSNGEYVDSLFARLSKTRTQQRVENAEQIWLWLAKDRIDYALRSQGEVPYLQTRGEANVQDLVEIAYPDLEQAIPEHVMCTKQFGKSKMERLAAALSAE